MTENNIPISLAEGGKTLTVSRVMGGCTLRMKLNDMGLTPGTEVSVVGGCPPGPLLIDIRGSRVGLGFGVAQKIIVKEGRNEQKTDCGCPGRQP